MTQFTKPVFRPVTTRQEIHTLTSANGSGLTYTLCDRTDLSDKRANYFVSFNLPHKQSAFSLENDISLQYPELQQLNVDKIVIVDIDSSFYNELIDGRSVSFTVPQTELGDTSISAKTVVSTTYGNLKKNDRNQLLGTNISFLFCDEINAPYSGTIANGSTKRVNNISWVNTNNSITKQIVATSYSELKTKDINTDTRTSINYAVNVGDNYPTNTDKGYNYDIPVGFVALDKGYLVLTHPDIVDNIPFSQGIKKSDNTPNIGPTSGTSDIYFPLDTQSNVNFIDIDINYTSSIVCLIMPKEFYKTTNPTYDFTKAVKEETEGTFGMDPVYISEIALHNVRGEIIAFAKLDKPIQKKYGDFLSFTIDIKA